VLGKITALQKILDYPKACLSATFAFPSGVELQNPIRERNLSHQESRHEAERESNDGGQAKLK
jgi:hypothetical protein